MKRLSLSSAAQLVGALLLCLQWLVIQEMGAPLSLALHVILPGIAVFGAAFLLSWAAELAQMEIPQALALAFVALVAVLPEYAVDMYFAWKAGKDPSYVTYAAANMTGGNRLLIGAGWAAVVIAYWFKTRKKSIVIERGQRLELVALLAATLYSFVIPFKKTISLFDSLALLLLFAFYMVGAAQSEISESEMEEGPAEWLSKLSQTPRRLITLGLFGLAAGTIFKAAEPFAEGLLKMGQYWGVEQFVLVQWLAPLASEAPEFIVAILFALRHRPSAGIGALVSSKVNQWTLLVGMLPIAFCLSSHRLQPLHMDARQVEELFLTSAQSLFALVLLCDLDFSLADGLTLFALFIIPFFFSSPVIRIAIGGVYIFLTGALLMFRSASRKGLSQTIKEGKRRFGSFN